MNEQLRTAAMQSRIVFLDYLRIFAFASVLVGHKLISHLFSLAEDATVHASVRTLASWLIPLVVSGGVGIIVFFLVSGYIITHVLQHETTIEFLIKRAFRIYPLFVMAVLMEYLSLWQGGTQPPLGTLIPQLLLVGDLFQTPYALNGAEWTLRVEALFYLLMAAAHAMGLLTTARRWLPPFFLALLMFAALWQPLASIPGSFGHGYLTMFGPFLLVGSMFYLFQFRLTSLSWLLAVSVFAVVQYYRLVVQLYPSLAGIDFVFPALALFSAAWFFRQHLLDGPVVRLLSDLTYSVYLFHNWLFDVIKQWLADRGVAWLHADLQALILLLLFCYAAVRLVERPAIRLGRRAYSAFRMRRPALATDAA